MSATPSREDMCTGGAERSETAIFQGYRVTKPTGQCIFQGTIVDSYFTPPFPTSSLEQH